MRVQSDKGARSDACHGREWSRVTGAAFFPCCGREVSSSSLRLVDVVSPPGKCDRPASR